jgi:hypothetical protein
MAEYANEIMGYPDFSQDKLCQGITGNVAGAIRN